MWISLRDVRHVLRRQWQLMLLCMLDHNIPLESVTQATRSCQDYRFMLDLEGLYTMFWKFGYSFANMWPRTIKKQSWGSFLWNWDVYITWKLNKYTLHWCMVCYDWTIFVRDTAILKIRNLRVQKNLNIEKIAFKVVQMKSLAMHITNQKLSFDIFTVGNLQNIFVEHDLYLISNNNDFILLFIIT